MICPHGARYLCYSENARTEYNKWRADNGISDAASPGRTLISPSIIWMPLKTPCRPVMAILKSFFAA